VLIMATTEGRRVALETRSRVVDLANELVEPYSQAEVERMASLLQRMLAHLEGLTERSKPKARAAPLPDRR
jgi:hypothetical protein